MKTLSPPTAASHVQKAEEAYIALLAAVAEMWFMYGTSMSLYCDGTRKGVNDKNLSFDSLWEALYPTCSDQRNCNRLGL